MEFKVYSCEDIINLPREELKYPSFPSIERIENIRCFINEKIDGTNGMIEITKDALRFGSRNTYLSSKEDNHGFYKFCKEYITYPVSDIIIRRLYPNNPPTYPVRIYGEWFGKGIQRTYGLKARYFMPFNPYHADALTYCGVPYIVYPAELYSGKFSVSQLELCMDDLKLRGSKVIEDYMNPEGVVIYFPKYNFSLKRKF